MKISKNEMILSMIAFNNQDAVEIASLIFGNGLIYSDVSDFDYQSRLIDAMPVNLRLDYENGLQIINKVKVKALRPEKDFTPKKCIRCEFFNADKDKCTTTDFKEIWQANCLPDEVASYVLPIEAKNTNKKKYNPFSWIAKARKCTIQEAISIKSMADIISSGNNETFKYCVKTLTFDELVLLSDALNDVEPDVSDVNNLTYGYNEFEYNHLERQDVDTSGRYGHIDNRADLYKTAKNESSVDYCSFKKHESLLNEIQESCTEYQVAKQYIRSGKIQKAKSKARLVAYTYKQQNRPDWLTPDRLNGLWQEVRV